ncbi:NAD-dependent epimerase/dehydratase family protein [Paracrocinitomix mangrovi]|uniref:NAD-dependent epimerase/dehydratase family protein n=1 Tax=Paracrocinitomix mangrovi TaxID=2862509 RepID=UPI001C8D06A3|nr:NAD-dependent epimerase/dehydratase family protein [Paracrocinitomix mangrovi]UKN02567.1 NAD-dependent epimerase/dehydratase family protein [Paracrocinitomix mangrovi]
MHMKIGVTGASGHVGNVVCRKLIEQGHDVRALYNKDKRALEDVDVELFQGNVLDAGRMKEFVDGCDVVINLAAIISIYGDPTGIVFKTNTEGPRNVLNACIEKGVKKIVHASSTHAVLEEPLNEPFAETRPYKQPKHFAYDYSKATGEQIMLDAFKGGKIEGCVVRPSCVIGPYDFKPSEMGKAIKDFYNRKIPMLPPGGYNCVDVRDVADSIIRAIDHGENGEIYLLAGKYYSIKELANVIHNVSGVKIPKSVTPFWLLKFSLPFVKAYGKMTKAAPLFTIEAITALKLGHPGMDWSKAEKSLQHKYTPLDKTIGDYLDWQKKQGVIK